MTRMNVIRCALAAALIAIPHAASLAADGQFDLTAGAEYTTGKYGGTQSTDIFFVPVTGKYETGPWLFKLMVPYIRITGPGNVIGAGDDRLVREGGTAAAIRTDSGLGDVVASAFYNVLSGRNAQLGLDVGAKIKFGTADSPTLGTGENDFSLQADVFKPIGAFTTFGTLGYRWYGDPPGLDLRNVFFGAVGVGYKVSQPTTVGLAYDFREPISAGGSRVSELSAYISQRLSGGWKAQYYAIIGFSDASPDYGIGLTFNYTF
jgi:hypothetical protein